MPTSFNQGTPRDPNIAKQLNKLYRANSAPESNTYQASRKKLESSFRAEPSARPTPQIGKQSFTENFYSKSTPKGYEDKARQARQQARQDFLRTTGQIQEIARGARNPNNFVSKTTPKAVLSFPTNTPRPAIPGAGVASGVASLGLGFLVDRYATPYLMNAAQNAGGILSAELHYKLGNISEPELAEALRYVREGNGAKWGERINQIRTIQGLAKRGIKLKNTVPVLPFTGGQLTRVSYTVVLNCITANGQTIEHQGTGHWGKIGGAVQVIPAGTFVNGDSQWIFNILSQGLTYQAPPKDEQSFHQLRPDGYLRVPRGFEIVSASVARVIREDGQPDVLPTQPLSTTKYVPIVPSANTAAYRQATPVQTPPLVDKPPEENKAKPTIITIPIGSPVRISSDNESVQLTPSTTAPSTIEIPHPRTIPTNPNEEKKIPPLTISSPTSPDIKLETFGSNPVTINIPGYNPIIVTPQSNKPQGALPIQDINRQYQPVASTATPTQPGVTPTPTTPTTPTPTATKPATTDDLEQFKKDLEKLILTGGIIAGLTPAIQNIGERVAKIGENTTPESITTAAAAGTCRTVQPGGCTTKALDDAVGRINQNSNNNVNALDAANALANAKQLEQLGIINNKLGAQLPGGLAGGISRVSNFLGIDRLMNLVTTIVVLHNAAMLSSALKDTLLSMVSSVGKATGLLVDAEGNAVDTNSLFNQGVETFLKGLLGDEVYENTKLTFNRANRFYQATTNIVNSVRNAINGVQNIVERGAEYTGKIGNSLKRFGIVGENAYSWMSENMNTKTAWLDRLQTRVSQTSEVISGVDDIAQNVISVQDSVKQLTTEKEEFDKALKDLTPNKPADNSVVASQVKLDKDASQAPATTFADIP